MEAATRLSFGIFPSPSATDYAETLRLVRLGEKESRLLPMTLNGTAGFAIARRSGPMGSSG